MKDNPTFSMVNESDDEDDDMEDDSETGAMLRPTEERTGIFRVYYFIIEFGLKLWLKFQVNFLREKLYILGGESIRMYGGRRSNDNSANKFPALMDDNSD